MKKENLERAVEIAQCLPPMQEIRQLLSEPNVTVTVQGSKSVDLPKLYHYYLLNFANAEINKMKNEIEKL